MKFPEDILEEGPIGDAQRSVFEQAIADGTTDPVLCSSLARQCLENGCPGLGLWFLGLEIRTSASVNETDLALIAELIEALGLAAEEAERESGTGRLAGFFAVLDRLPLGCQELCMQGMAVKLASEPEAAAAFVQRYSDVGDLEGSQSFLSLCMAVHMLGGELAAAKSVAGLIKAFSHKTRWTHGALARLAASVGDYEEAEKQCKTAIENDLGALRIMGFLAAVLYARGKEGEARDALKRSFSRINPEEFALRRNEIADWCGQLQEALANRTLDGGELYRIGAAANYTDHERLLGFWRDHDKNCGRENTYRTVSAYTNTVMFDALEAVLAERPGITKIVNYGTLSGVREYEMAGRLAHAFWGYDVSEEATGLNKERFVRDNLFFSSDFESLLSDMNILPGGSIMTHCRTMDIMFPEALRNVYRRCRAMNLDFILSAEYLGASILTLDYPDFTKETADTVIWEGIVMIHDIPKILKEEGYRVISTEYRPIPLLVSVGGEGLQPCQLIQLVLAERVE